MFLIQKDIMRMKNKLIVNEERMMNSKSKKVFISYSWAVQEKVIELAERLIANGVEVVLDVYDLKDGNDKYAFMEQSVNDASVDHVLIICDKTYTEKANARSGGVGDETVIITPELYGNTKQEKFIPIIFEKDEEGKAYCPTYIKSRIYIDLSEDARYESEYEKLLRDIYQRPMYRKPALGKMPEWLENDTVDLSSIRDVIKQVKGLTGENTTKADFLLRRAADDFADAAKKYVVMDNKPIEEEFLDAIDRYKSFRDLLVEYCEALIFCGLPLSGPIVDLFERLYNELNDYKTRNTISQYIFDLADFMIWEFFIDVTATLIYYERYKELYDILMSPYFLRRDKYNDNVEDYGYCVFRTYSHVVEDKCKPKSDRPNLYTMAGEIIINREKKPILTKESISNADLLLYQLSYILPIPSSKRLQDYWFPLTYVYHLGPQVIWQRLKSKKYCDKIAPLFGVCNAVEIAEKIKGTESQKGVGYNNSFECARSILSNIKLEEIGSLN